MLGLLASPKRMVNTTSTILPNSKLVLRFQTSQQAPLRTPLGKPLVARRTYDCQTIDPMVFIDDDGAAYLYFGQGKTATL